MDKDFPDVRILSDDIVQTDWSTFHRMRYSITTADHGEVLQEREFLNRGNAVAVLAYCAEKSTLLLVKQFRIPVFINRATEAMMLEICGGMLQGKEPEHVALSEAEEELGVPIHTLRHAFSAYSSPGSITEKIDYYLAEYDVASHIAASAGNHHEGEHVSVCEMSFRQVHDSIRAGIICDARTVALFYFLLHELNLDLSLQRTNYPQNIG